jgi:hypothetical protein
MSSYDPQRNRPRARPSDDEPAPVDALLGAPALGAPAHDHGHDHDHGQGHDHDHGHDHGVGVPAPVRLAVAVASAIGLVALVRRLRRRRG